jgi:hypothetical protein
MDDLGVPPWLRKPPYGLNEITGYIIGYIMEYNWNT